MTKAVVKACNIGKMLGTSPYRDAAGAVRRYMKEQNEEMMRLLDQGQTIVEVASSLDETPEYVSVRAKDVLGNAKFQRLLMKQRKKGKWSDDEMNDLVALRQQTLRLSDISVRLQRTELSIKKQLQVLRTSSFEVNTVEGPQELPQGLVEGLFSTRLSHIFAGLQESNMTVVWQQALQQKPPEAWLASISDNIPSEIKVLLGGLRPPTWDELMSMPPLNSTDVGVYARLASTRFDIQIPNDRYLYVGSVSRYSGGLNARVAEHTARVKWREECRTQQDVRSKNLKGPGGFVTFMTMRMDTPDKDTILDVRRTVTLAEAILTVWLGALEPREDGPWRLCSWDTEVLGWTAWSSHNPLTKNVTVPK